MIQKLERLLDLMIVYYEKAGNPVRTVTEINAEQEKIQVDILTKTRKPRTPKAEAVVESVAPAAPEMSDAESATEVLAVTRAYVSRFQKQDPDGQKRALAILANDFKKPGIKALDHAERLAFIAKLKAEIAAADKVAA